MKTRSFSGLLAYVAVKIAHSFVHVPRRGLSLQLSPRLILCPVLLAQKSQANEESSQPSHTLVPTLALGTGGALYWYWMVFGALASSQGWPGIPEGLPMVPGWPPSPEELQSVLDDSAHFFYLNEVVGSEAPEAPVTRLAIFNAAEAWIFAMLPALWADPKRAPRPILLGLWAVLGINLTNAFLLPYLALTSTFSETSKKRLINPWFHLLFASVALSVVGYAGYSSTAGTTSEDWAQFFAQCLEDRTYLAFCVDLAVFSTVQPYLLQRVRGTSKGWDFVPFIGLITWLLASCRAEANAE